MATDVQSTEAGPRTGLQLYRFTVRQFERMIDAGVFPEAAHAELLGGVVVDKMTKYPPHTFTVEALAKRLRRIEPDSCYIREEKPIQVGRWSRPEPDIAMVRGAMEDYRGKTPRATDPILIIEVADSSYPKDRGDKWRRYAAAGIPTYWIANLPAGRLEVYTVPTGRGRSAIYRNCVLYPE